MKRLLISKLLFVIGLAFICQLAVIAQTKGDGNEQTSPDASTEGTSPETSKFVYSYDANGNRIKSHYHIVVQALTKSAVLDSVFQDEEMVLPNEVNFYPNPTSGLVKVNIQGFDEDLVWNAQIYSTSGKQIYSDRITSSMFQFDLSTNEAGVYILRIQGGSLFNEWKIIKQ